MKRRPPRWDQAGFTLVEALIGGLLAMLLGLPCYALLRANLSALDIVASRSQQAEQARETFRLLGDGTASFGTQMVEGLHSRASLPSPWALRSTTALGQFVTSDGAVQLSAVSITCQSAGVPIADCTGTEKRTSRDGAAATRWWRSRRRTASSSPSP